MNEREKEGKKEGDERRRGERGGRIAGGGERRKKISNGGREEGEDHRRKEIERKGAREGRGEEGCLNRNGNLSLKVEKGR